MGNEASGTAFEFEGRPFEPGKLPPMVRYDPVTPGFFKSMRIPVTRGRDFTWDDLRPGVLSVVVNETAAKQYWPGEDPLGKRLRRSGDAGKEHTPWFTVVGVVGGVRQVGPREAPSNR